MDAPNPKPMDTQTRELLAECFTRIELLNDKVREQEQRHRADYSRDMQLFVGILKDLMAVVDVALGYLAIDRPDDASASLVKLHKKLAEMIATAPVPRPEVH